MNSNSDPEAMMQCERDAGGEVIRPVADRGEMVGFVGFFRDTEGNRIGIHGPHEC